MQIADYLLDHQGFDWPRLLAGWSRLLPSELTVWLVNRFGDLFLVFDDGSVHMLDIAAGEAERVADSREDFAAKLDDGDNADQWLMIPLVDELVAAGMPLPPGHCYGFKMPPVLGGDYDTENVAVLPVAEHYGFNAELHDQIRDLPDGAQVKLVIEDRPRQNPKSE